MHYVRDGCEARFENELHALMKEFGAVPANLGVTAFRPGLHRDGVYRIVYKFSSRNAIDAWHDSPTYRMWLETKKTHDRPSPHRGAHGT